MNTKVRTGRPELGFAWRSKDDPAKRSPNSLRLTLHAIRVAGPHESSTRTNFPSVLDGVHRSNGARYGLDNIPGTVLRQSESGEAHLKYAVLEAYANLTNVPLAVLLLVSRYVAQADSRSIKETTEHTADLIEGMRNVLNAIEATPKSGDLDLETIMRLIESYHGTSR